MWSIYDIDTYLDPFTPPRLLHLLPRPISHFFGYRPPSSVPQPPHTLIIWAFNFLGAFSGVALIEAVYLHLPHLDGHAVPIVIASLGAAAILEYNSIESPLAQPRNLIFGQVLSAVIGVGITKLFELLPATRFEELEWLAGALAVGTASLVMSVTKTVHPPAGATALLAATTAEIRQLGWWAVALVFLGSMLMLVSALLLNNIARQFPIYWWTPSHSLQRREQNNIEMGAPEISESGAQLQYDNSSRNMSHHRHLNATMGNSESSSSTMLASAEVEMKHSKEEGVQLTTPGAHEVVVSSERVTVPEDLELDDSEKKVLTIIQKRIREMTRTRR
ncbi:hypothetical protein DV736_g5750, partial [Chaetothyriales sp. CBS 134916]